MENKTWYAVMRNRQDDDWGYGSHDLNKAKEMAKDMESNEVYIAVIDDGPDPVCVDEIELSQFKKGEKMKKIINGKKYDTETARSLGCDSYGNRGDFHFWYEELYQKKTGEYFLYGEGGAASRYVVQCGTNEWCGWEEIIPMTEKEAKKWVEEHLDGDEYEAIFGDVED